MLQETVVELNLPLPRGDPADRVGLGGRFDEGQGAALTRRRVDRVGAVADNRAAEAAGPHSHAIRCPRVTESGSTERDGRDRGRLVAAAAISVSALGWFPTTALVIALPDVQTQFGTSVTELGWVPNAYTLAVAATIIAAGRISDRLGHRRFFIVGTLGFSAAMALAAISPGFVFLLVAVAIAGVAGAFMFTSSLAILKARFSGRALTLTIALWAAASGLGQALGVPLGGLLEDSALGWRSIFYLSIPFGLFAAWVGIRRVQESREATTAPLDVAGAVGVGATVVMLVIAGMQGPDWGWLAPSTLGVIAGAALAAAVRGASGAEGERADPPAGGIPGSRLRRRHHDQLGRQRLPLGRALLWRRSSWRTRSATAPARPASRCWR